MNKHDHHLFLSWLIATSLIATSLVIIWHQGYLHVLYSQDKSKICLAIGLIYIGGSLHCALRSWSISKELMLAEEAFQLIRRYKRHAIHLDNTQLRLGTKISLPNSFLTQFLIDSIISRTHSVDVEQATTSNTAITDIYTDKLKGSHELGWFFVDAMIKLGLLGTVIGFIVMLSSVTSATNFDINAMQQVMQQMGAGMGTALYTTLTGVSCSLLLAWQYQLVDRGADDLIQQAMHTTEVYVLPKFIASS